jgi:hypothetical protein
MSAVTYTSPLSDEERRRFRSHPPTPDTGPRHDRIRAAHLALAEIVAEIVPAGRHRSLALTALQESMMWANAAVACDTKPGGTS